MYMSKMSHDNKTDIFITLAAHSIVHELVKTQLISSYLFEKYCQLQSSITECKYSGLNSILSLSSFSRI